MMRQRERQADRSYAPLPTDYGLELDECLGIETVGYGAFLARGPAGKSTSLLLDIRAVHGKRK